MCADKEKQSVFLCPQSNLAKFGRGQKSRLILICSYDLSEQQAVTAEMTVGAADGPTEEPVEQDWKDWCLPCTT